LKGLRLEIINGVDLVAFEKDEKDLIP